MTRRAAQVRVALYSLIGLEENVHESRSNVLIAGIVKGRCLAHVADAGSATDAVDILLNPAVRGGR